MELYFASREFNGSSSMALDAEESRHCIKVMRHREGDIINVIDGSGNLFKCRIDSTGYDSQEQNSKKGKHRQGQNQETVNCSIEEEIPGFGAHPYHLTMAVAPTKNMERYEWFLEKATETGLDTIVPVICDHSERKDVNIERCNRILKSAVKQSLKGALPQMEECIPLTQWIEKIQETDLRLICYCGNEYPKQEITATLKKFFESSVSEPSVTIIIGPEGDFSPQEVKCAMEHGFKAVTLGPSRLRVESAALLSVNAVYLATI